MRILFATPEVLDFVQVGGLAAVSAALPRALQGLADIRLIIPGYSQVLAGLKDLTILGSFPAFAGLPAFEVGFGRAVDGLPFYVVVCPGLFERVGSPYGDELRKPRDGLYLPLVGRLQGTPPCISAVRNDRVFATKPKSPVTFYVNGVARFTFFRREDRLDRSNKLITG
jgi:Starch synthase catalytic domain